MGSKWGNIYVDRVDEATQTHPLVDVLDSYKKELDIGNRQLHSYEIGYTRVLLEELKRVSIGDNHNVYLMNFIRHRDVGPVQFKENELSTGVELPDDTKLGEATSALYCPECNLFLMVYNHDGVKEGVIAQYFSRLADALFKETCNQYELTPVFESELLAEIEISNRITMIDIGVAIEREAFANTDEPVNMASKYEDVERERVIIFANKKRGKKEWWPFSMFKEKHAEASSKGEIEIENVTYQDMDGQSHTVNLMKHRRKIKFEVTCLDIVKRAYTSESKFELLQNKFKDYIKSLD